MPIDRAGLKKIAHLARINVLPEEEDHLVNQLNGIIKFVEQLGEVDTTGVVPMTTAAKMKLPLRKDVVNDGDNAANLLANGPEVTGAFFVVPKVIE